MTTFDSLVVLKDDSMQEKSTIHVCLTSLSHQWSLRPSGLCQTSQHCCNNFLQVCHSHCLTTSIKKNQYQVIKVL